MGQIDECLSRLYHHHQLVCPSAAFGKADSALYILDRFITRPRTYIPQSHSCLMNPATRRLISSSSIPRHVAARSRNATFIRRASLSTLTKNRVPRDVSPHSKACNSTLAEASTSTTPLPASLLKQSSDNATEHHTKIFKGDDSKLYLS